MRCHFYNWPCDSTVKGLHFVAPKHPKWAKTQAWKDVMQKLQSPVYSILWKTHMPNIIQQHLKQEYPPPPPGQLALSMLPNYWWQSTSKSSPQRQQKALKYTAVTWNLVTGHLSLRSILAFFPQWTKIKAGRIQAKKQKNCNLNFWETISTACCWHQGRDVNPYQLSLQKFLKYLKLTCHIISSHWLFPWPLPTLKRCIWCATRWMGGHTDIYWRKHPNLICPGNDSSLYLAHLPWYLTITTASTGYYNATQTW